MKDDIVTREKCQWNQVKIIPTTQNENRKQDSDAKRRDESRSDKRISQTTPIQTLHLSNRHAQLLSFL